MSHRVAAPGTSSVTKNPRSSLIKPDATVLSPKLQNSPYLKLPFKPFPVEKARASLPAAQPKRKIFAPFKENHSPRRYGPPPTADYPQRAKFWRNAEIQYRDETLAKYTEMYSSTPYSEVLENTRQRCLLNSQLKARARADLEVAERRKVVAESKAATEESYKHDIFHGDKMFSSKYRCLRIIPSTQRYETDGSVVYI